MDFLTFHASLTQKTFERVCLLKNGSWTFRKRYRVLLEPKQQEMVGYRHEPLASKSN